MARANHRVVEYTGKSLEDLNRKGWADLVHPDDLDNALRERIWLARIMISWGTVARLWLVCCSPAGNFAGFAAGYITGVLKDRTLVGAMMLLSGGLMIGMREETQVERSLGRVVKSA